MNYGLSFCYIAHFLQAMKHSNAGKLEQTLYISIVSRKLIICFSFPL